MFLNTIVSWQGEAACVFRMVREFAHGDLIGVAMRFLPLQSAHPGRLQDDGARQVSWLPGLGLARLPGLLAQVSGIFGLRSPVTVAGAATALNRVPYT